MGMIAYHDPRTTAHILYTPTVKSRAHVVLVQCYRYTRISAEDHRER